MVIEADSTALSLKSISGVLYFVHKVLIADAAEVKALKNSFGDVFLIGSIAFLDFNEALVM